MLSKKTGTFFLLLWAALSLTFSSVKAQSFDYSEFPRLDFSINHLTLELNIDPEKQLLEGHATYDIEANVGGVDSLILDAAHMDIRNVQVGGEELSFRLGNDSLFVALGRSSTPGDRYKVEVMYETGPMFGVHFEEGTVWSSLLPFSTRHWLPVIDHPRVAFTTDITLTIPGNYKVLAPGKKGSEEVTSLNEKRVQFQSKRPVPASALWFATGPLQSSETSMGIKQIRVSGTSRLMNSSGERLLEQAYDLLSATEKELGIEYPFETLDVILLDDHRWETKPYAAGTVFLFENRGNLQAQLRRGIFAQWMGVMQREEQWSDADAITLYQTVLNHSVAENSVGLLKDPANPDASVNPYHAFSPSRWNRWQQFYPQWQDSTWKQVIEQSLENGLLQSPSVKSWRDFAEYWYRQSGQPWFQPPQLVVEGQQQTTGRDSVIYEVDYQFNEAQSELVLEFRAQDSVITELVSLPMIVSTGQSTDTLEVTFSGESESVMFNLDPLVSYVDVDGDARPNITLEQFKPVPFILGQLRNAESPEAKADAARQLGRHADNPDLQLAITDMLSREQPANVEAALLYSLGEITKGASGTAQQFLDALRQENTEIQQAALGALGHYRGNQQVMQTLQQFAVQNDTMPLFKQATESFFAAADSANSSALSDFAKQVMNADTTGTRTINVLEKMARRSGVDTETITNNLNILIGENYAFPIRAKALRLLIRVDTDQSLWKTRVNKLLADNDPRMRFLAVQAIGDLPFLEAGEFLKDRLLDEYDGRVYYEMQKVL